MHYLNSSNQPYPHIDESILHYLTMTEKVDFAEALQYLRDASRHWQGLSKLSLSASGLSLVASLMAVGAATAIAATSIALIPLAAAAFAGIQVWGSRKELQVRASEYEFLKSHADVLELMLTAYGQGCDPLALIRCYNRIVGAYSVESGDCQGVDPIAAFSQQMLHSNEQKGLFSAALAKMGHSADVADVRFAPWLSTATARYQPKKSVEAGYVPQQRQLPSTPHSALPTHDQPTIRDAGGEGTLKPLDLTELDQLPKQYRWLREFVTNTSLVLGSQGSGKSWMVRLLAWLKKLKGYRVIVFDPNSNQYEWRGMEFYGSYEDIAGMMAWYVDEVQALYEEFRQTEMTEEQWRKQLWKRGKAIAIICEEFSTYADFIEDKELTQKFIKTAATLSRKQEAPVTFVTHNLTKECLGRAEGVFDVFKRMQRLTLDVTTDPKTDQPVATGSGTVKGVDSDDLRQVVTPQLTQKITDFRSEKDKLADTRDRLLSYERMEGFAGSEPGSDTVPPNHPSTLPEPNSEPLNRLDGKGSSDSLNPVQNSEPFKKQSEPVHEPMNRPDSEGSSGSLYADLNSVQGSEPRFTPLQLPLSQIRAIVQNLVQNSAYTQTQIIEIVWQVKKGGTDSWKKAHAEFKQVMGE